MKFAEIVNDLVVNLFVADPDQKAELEAMIQHEMVPADLLRLQIGDLRVGGNWTRNIDGEQVVLTEEPTRDELMERIAALGRETAQTDAALEEMGVQVYE